MAPTHLVAVITLGAGLLLAPSTAEACSCLAPTVATAWNYGGEFVTADVKGKKIRGSYRYFLAEITGVYQGCATVGETVIFRTHKSSATCGGLPLAVGSEVLLESYDTGSTHLGYRILSYGLCGVNKLVSEVTVEEREFLSTRLVTCDTTGSATCSDGSPPVSCVVDPCSTAPACPDGDCYANYCDGCGYEYFDDWGYEVCP